eukprot:5798755-Amphidinium_carterae.1
MVAVWVWGFVGGLQVLATVLTTSARPIHRELCGCHCMHCCHEACRTLELANRSSCLMMVREVLALRKPPKPGRTPHPKIS